MSQELSKHRLVPREHRKLVQRLRAESESREHLSDPFDKRSTIRNCTFNSFHERQPLKLDVVFGDERRHFDPRIPLAILIKVGQVDRYASTVGLGCTCQCNAKAVRKCCQARAKGEFPLH